MAKDNVMDFNLEEFDFESLSSEIFGDNVTTAKLNPDLQGKILAVYGANNAGKTTQCAKFVKFSYIIPFERGVNALGKGTQILKTSNWADAKKHTRMLTTNKKLLAALKAGVTIGVILDGLENMSVFAKQYICDQAGVEKFSKAGAHGSQWEEYANEIFNMVTKLSQCGYTLFFIGHSAESKEESDYFDFACDKRTGKPVKDVADFVFYLETNGVDGEGNVVPSSAYLAEHKPTNEFPGFFARCRFPYVQKFYQEWDAEVVKQAIYDGIVEQAKVEGAELVGFAEVQAKYESTFVMTLDEVKEAIFNRLDELDAKKMTQQADDVLLSYLDSPDDIEKLTSKQMQTAQSILNDLDALLGE